MKKLYILGLSAILAIILTGCSKDEKTVTDPSTYEKIQKALVDMETYKSEANVQYISNKNSNAYKTMQYCKMSGEYRVEVTGPEQSVGNITIYDGESISQYNRKNGGKIFVLGKEDMARSEIFITSFVKNYLHSQNTSVSAGSFDKGKCTVLEAVIPGDHPYLATEKLWVDNKTLAPVKLVIYDPGGGERIVVTYENFEYNVELANDIFAIDMGVE